MEEMKGKIVQVSGPVIDVEFEGSYLPAIKDALYALVVVVIFGESASVEVEVLGVERRHECADALQGCAPKSGHEVDAERQRCHGKEESHGAYA